MIFFFFTRISHRYILWTTKSNLQVFQNDKLNSLSSYDLFLTHLSSIATSPRKIQRAYTIFQPFSFLPLFLLIFFFLIFLLTISCLFYCFWIWQERSRRKQSNVWESSYLLSLFLMVFRVLCSYVLECNGTMKFSHVEHVGILGCEIYCRSSQLLDVFSYPGANYLSNSIKVLLWLPQKPLFLK